MGLSTEAYLSALMEGVSQGKEVSMLITGNSMQPFLLGGRDTIWFRKPDRPLSRGDMAFFRRESGQYVMHRVQKVTSEGCIFLGDNQTVPEGPVPNDRICAVVTRVRRKGKELGPGSFWWEFFRGFWLHIVPIRHFLMDLYRIFFNRRLR